MTAYYNEIDPFAAQWLRNLIAGGMIAPGDVDERSIVDVQPSDLSGYRQCHFFAGIGVWSYSLRSAGWADDRQAWTGSCPCQPFSDAGAKAGFSDARHLWPHWFRLISECRPVTVLGEQVASRDALAWLDLVSTDLEGAGYAVGAVDLPACSVGAPHIRQRLWFVADSERIRIGTGRPSGTGRGTSVELDRYGDAERVVANANQEPRRQRNQNARGSHRGGSPESRAGLSCSGGDDSAVAYAHEAVLGVEWRAGLSANGVSSLGNNADGREPIDVMGDPGGPRSRRDTGTEPGQKTAGERSRDCTGGVGDGARVAGPVNGFWRDAEWIPCRDGKARPVEPGISPLVIGATGRVGKLRAYGNAIVAPLAIEVIRAYMAESAIARAA